MKLTIKVERGFDGRWIAEAPQLAWVVGYGFTPEEAICKVEQLAIEEVAERVASGQLTHSAFNVSFEVLLPARTVDNHVTASLHVGNW